jgi:nucleoside phosphorylase
MGGFNIIVVLLCNPGKAIAASTAASLRSSYLCIKFVLLTGVCAGVPNAEDRELLLGDVVITETVV